MAEVIFSPTARVDLLDIIARLTVAAGTRVAVKYEDLFKRAVTNLEHFPGIGSPRPMLGANVRVVVIAPLHSDL
jgi:plasmid stabilization system protein ParE